MKSSILILIAIFVLFSCKGKGPDQEIVSEVNEDKTYSSDAYLLKETDNVFIENSTVFEEDGKWIFKNKVRGQTTWRTVRFTVLISSEKTIQFGNP